VGHLFMIAVIYECGSREASRVGGLAGTLQGGGSLWILRGGLGEVFWIRRGGCSGGESLRRGLGRPQSSTSSERLKETRMRCLCRYISYKNHVRILTCGVEGFFTDVGQWHQMQFRSNSPKER